MVSSANNGINDTVGASISGVTNTLTITNASNTASSAARATVVVGGGSSADPTVNWNVSGVTNWEMGIDNSDSDKWKLSKGTALGTNDTITADTSGRVLKPLQPSFFAYLSNTISNVTGDGTVYTVISDVEVYDVGSNYDNTTGIFTAPVDGNYLFIFDAQINSVGTQTGFTIQLSINGNLYRLHTSNPMNLRNQANACGLSAPFQFFLSAGHQVFGTVTCLNGSKTVGIRGLDGGSTTFTSFSGYLLG